MAPSGQQDHTPKYRREQPGIRRKMLISAAMKCLAKEGIHGFTIDRICKQAGVSRGLINHYFGSKDGLLAEIYRGSLYDMVSTRIAHLSKPYQMDDITPGDRLTSIIDATFTPEFFSRANLRIWLALWGEVATNTMLREVHRELYGIYRQAIAREIGAIADARGIELNADKLALSFLALVDGLWLECCLDDTAIAPDDIREVALTMLEAHLGPLRQ